MKAETPAWLALGERRSSKLRNRAWAADDSYTLGTRKTGKVGGISDGRGDCIGALACYLILTTAIITIKQTEPLLFPEQLALVGRK